MGFSGDQTYPAPVEAVIALFVDSNVVRARYEAAGDRDIEILECGPDGDGFVIRTSRTVDVDLPGFARRVLKPTNTLVQVDRWSPADAPGARNGDFAIEVKGAPLNIHGTMRVAPAGGGCRHTVQGKLEVKVPVMCSARSRRSTTRRSCSRPSSSTASVPRTRSLAARNAP